MLGRSVIVVVALTSVAVAQPTPDHTKAAELFEDGRRLMNDRDPAGACAKFAESIRLEPLAAGTMLNLGLCNQQLGRNKTALYWFRKAQLRATETDPPLPAYEQEARDHTTYLATIVPVIKLELPAGVPDITIMLDDEPVRPEDYAHLEVDPGHHVIVATTPNKPTFRKEVMVTDRNGTSVVVRFGDAPDTNDRRPPPPEDGGRRRRIAAYLAIGSGAVLASSLGLTLYEKHVYNDNKAAAQMGDMAALDKAHNATEVARDYGTGLAIAGVVAGGIAVYLWVSAPDGEPMVAPAIAPGQAGAVITGRF
jgi:hypothetical protein